MDLQSLASLCKDRRTSRDSYEIQRLSDSCDQLGVQHVAGELDPCIDAGAQRLAEGQLLHALFEFERSCKFGNWWGCFCRGDVKRLVGNFGEACSFFSEMLGTYAARCRGLDKIKKKQYPFKSPLDDETIKYCATQDYVKWVVEQNCATPEPTKL